MTLRVLTTERTESLPLVRRDGQVEQIEPSDAVFFSPRAVNVLAGNVLLVVGAAPVSAVSLTWDTGPEAGVWAIEYSGVILWGSVNEVTFSFAQQPPVATPISCGQAGTGTIVSWGFHLALGPGVETVNVLAQATGAPGNDTIVWSALRAVRVA